MKLCKIDVETGVFIKDVLVDKIPMITVDGEQVKDPQYIEVPCPSGFYKPKWIGTEWVEGLSQAEIDEINNQPKPKTELEKMQEVIDQLLLDSLGV